MAIRSGGANADDRVRLQRPGVDRGIRTRRRGLCATRIRTLPGKRWETDLPGAAGFQLGDVRGHWLDRLDRLESPATRGHHPRRERGDVGPVATTRDVYCSIIAVVEGWAARRF